MQMIVARNQVHPSSEGPLVGGRLALPVVDQFGEHSWNWSPLGALVGTGFQQQYGHVACLAVDVSGASVMTVHTSPEADPNLELPAMYSTQLSVTHSGGGRGGAVILGAVVADKRLAWGLALLAAVGYGLLAGWWTPRGPVSTFEGLTAMGLGLLVGLFAGLLLRTRWAMLMARFAFAEQDTRHLRHLRSPPPVGAAGAVHGPDGHRRGREHTQPLIHILLATWHRSHARQPVKRHPMEGPL